MSKKYFISSMLKNIQIYLPGLMFTLAGAFIAFELARFLPVGAVVIGISLGVLIGNVFKLPLQLFPGINFSEKKILSWAIILMGVKLDFNIIKTLGLQSVLMIIAGIIFTIILALVLSRLFKLNFKLGLLLGIGNAVCGSSAIAATEKIIGAEKHQVGVAVTVVNFLGTLGMFVLPLLIKYILPFNDLQAGFLIGDTLQAVGQVVAAGFSINETVGHTATIVKMMRILMLTPLVISLMFYFHQRRKKTEDTIKEQAIPVFIIGFILMSLLPSFHLVSAKYLHFFGQLSHYFLLIAMVAIGFKINFKSVWQQGQGALLMGSVVFLGQILFALLMILYFK